MPNPIVTRTFASANLNGWNASFEYKPIRWLGGVADFGGSYGTQRVTLGCEAITSGCPPPPFDANARVYSVLLGPRVSVPIGKATPFVHALGGVAHTSLKGSSNFTDTSSSWATGGGLDYRLVKGVAWRFQGDSLNTSFFGKTQANFRFSTGLVVRF